MKKFKTLKPGDIIGIAAPAACFDQNKFHQGIKFIKELGFNVYYREDIFSQERYLAGSDQRRAEELTELLQKDDIKAILFARGGYGSQRIIPLLNISKIKANIKPVVGFSDTTALLTFLRQEVQTPTFYGPVITQLGHEVDVATRDSLFNSLTLELSNLKFSEGKTLKSGQARAELVGGCLSLLNSSLGTSYEIETKNKILFIEDVSEKIYVLDRMLTQLKNAGKLAKVKGLVFGSLGVPIFAQKDLVDMLQDVLKDFQGPIVIDFPAGHTNKFLTLPLGAKLILNAHVNHVPKFEFSL